MTEQAKQTQVWKSGPMQLKFSSLRKARLNKNTGEMEFFVRAEGNQDTKEGKEFYNNLRKLNRSLIVTHNTKTDEMIVEKDGNYIINARTQTAPMVHDAEGNRLSANEIPMISSGTVQLVVTPFESKKGPGKGGINLAGIKLLEIEEYKGNQVDEDTIAAALANA